MRCKFSTSTCPRESRNPARGSFGRLQEETDADLDVPDLPLTIRVVGTANDLDFVELELAASVPRTLAVRQDILDANVGVVNEHTIESRCGALRYGTYQFDRESIFSALTYGYGGTGAPDLRSPVIAWNVAGVSIAAGASTVAFPVAGGRNVTVSCDFDELKGQLTLRSLAVDGEYSLAVVCTATESDGSHALTYTDYFSPVGVYTGVSVKDRPKLDVCIRRHLLMVRLAPRDLLIPPGPDPFRDRAASSINRDRLEQAVGLLQAVDPSLAEEVRMLADLRFGVQDKRLATMSARKDQWEQRHEARPFQILSHLSKTPPTTDQSELRAVEITRQRRSDCDRA